jgi:hypothetical protein
MSQTTFTTFQKYFTLSLKFSSYAANVFLLSVITPWFSKFVSNNQIRVALYFVYSYLIFSVFSLIIKKIYKPNFLLQTGEQEGWVDGKLIINKEDYYKRVFLEKMMLSAILYYIFNILVCLVLSYFSGNTNIKQAILLSLGGGILYILNFFSLAILSILSGNQGLKLRAKVLIFSCGAFFHIPSLFYIVYAVSYSLK